MGAFDMIARGIANESNEEYSVYLKGDLCQMDAQHKFLTRWGISVKLSNFVYIEMISEIIFNPFQRSFT